MKEIQCKLGNMRKAVGWVVYPPSRTSDGTLLIQSDHRICQFNPETRKGMLSKHQANYATFLHLSKMMGATEVEVPQEVVDMAKAAQPQSGDLIGKGGGVSVFVA